MALPPLFLHPGFHTFLHVPLAQALHAGAPLVYLHPAWYAANHSVLGLRGPRQGTLLSAVPLCASSPPHPYHTPGKGKLNWLLSKELLTACCPLCPGYANGPVFNPNAQDCNAAGSDMVRLFFFFFKSFWEVIKTDSNYTQNVY